MSATPPADDDDDEAAFPKGMLRPDEDNHMEDDEEDVRGDVGDASSCFTRSLCAFGHSAQCQRHAGLHK